MSYINNDDLSEITGCSKKIRNVYRTISFDSVVQIARQNYCQEKNFSKSLNDKVQKYLA